MGPTDDTAVLTAEILAQDAHLRRLSRSPSISSSILDHADVQPRRPLPPIPDLRFEQSYLSSLKAANGVWWKIVLITLKDQVLFPLVQGLVFNLLMFGWKRWNSAIKMQGRGLGVRIRRKWWRMSSWALPKRE